MIDRWSEDYIDANYIKKHVFFAISQIPPMGIPRVHQTAPTRIMMLPYPEHQTALTQI